MAAPSSAHPAPARPAVAPPALWFGLFGAPLVWSLQLLMSYALVAHACYPASEPMATPVVDGLSTLVLVAGLVALVVALAAGGTAWRSWRTTRADHPGDEDALLEVGEGRTRFMALAGMLLSGVFLLGIILNAVPLFLVSPCG